MPPPSSATQHWIDRAYRLASAIRTHQPLSNADLLWLSRQRRAAADNRLSAPRHDVLVQLNLHKSIDELRFVELIQHIDAFIATHGHTNVPRTYRDPRDDYPTGQRVTEIRDRYHRGRISAHVTQELEQRPQWTWTQKRQPDTNPGTTS